MDRKILIDLLDDFAFGSHDIEQTADRIIELYKETQALQLQQTGVSGSTFIAISKETGKGYFFEYSDMYLWENDDSVDIYEVKYYRYIWDDDLENYL